MFVDVLISILEKISFLMMAPLMWWPLKSTVPRGLSLSIEQKYFKEVRLFFSASISMLLSKSCNLLLLIKLKKVEFGLLYNKNVRRAGHA